jgi:hypothetical protein
MMLNTREAGAATLTRYIAAVTICSRGTTIVVQPFAGGHVFVVSVIFI